jgi:hypothetical protein
MLQIDGYVTRDFLQFNFISSVVRWGIWNSRNGLVFNRLIWIDIKHVWRMTMSYLRNWKVPFKVQTWRKVDMFSELQTLLKTPPALMSS